jgi:prevent-host-death family protein
LYALKYNNAYEGATMQPIRLDEDIRPLSEFRSGVAAFIKRVNETRRPLVLTQHGRGVAVVVDIAEFEAMRERLAILDDIEVARAQIAADGGVAHAEAKDRVLRDLAE